MFFNMFNDTVSKYDAINNLYKAYQGGAISSKEMMLKLGDYCGANQPSFTFDEVYGNQVFFRNEIRGHGWSDFSWQSGVNHLTESKGLFGGESQADAALKPSIERLMSEIN